MAGEISAVQTVEVAAGETKRPCRVFPCRSIGTGVAGRTSCHANGGVLPRRMGRIPPFLVSPGGSRHGTRPGYPLGEKRADLVFTSDSGNEKQLV